MRRLFFFLFAFVAYSTAAFAQTVDVNTVVADPMTFTFNDGKHTVHGYIYSMLENATSCCGNDAIYLEVVFDQNGRVTGTKTLTGRNDCYKKSVEDIVRNVRWDASGVKSSKTIYFEVKPIIPCSGGGNENVYKTVPTTLSNDPAVASNLGNNDNTGDDDTGDDSMGDDSGDDMASGDDDMGDDDMGDDSSDDAFAGDDFGDDSGDDVAGDDVADAGDDSAGDDFSGDDSGDDGFLSDDAGDIADVADDNSSDTGDAWNNMYSDDSGNDNTAASDNSATTKTTPNKTVTTFNGNIPPQADKNYVSTGDKDPNESHADTHKNFSPTPVEVPRFDGGDDSRVAVMIKRHLRQQGVCGLAQALIELTVDPQGNVVRHNVLKTNDPKIAGLLPDVIKEIRFSKQNGVRYNYVTYVQFKTDIVCNAKGKGIDLDEVQDFIIVDTK